GRLTLEAYRGFLDPESGDLESLVVTVLIAVASVLLAGAIGVPLALVLHRRGSRPEKLLLAASLLPLALPPLIGAIAIYLVFGETGVLSRGLGILLGREGPGLSLGPIPTVLVVHALTMYPIFLLFTTAALARRDPSLEEAARGLGASRVRTFLAVTLPGMKPALRGASLLVLLSSTASFSAPYLFAPDEPILSVRIFTARLAGDVPRSLALTTALTGVALLSVLVLRPRREEAVFSAGRATRGRAPRGALLAAAPVVLLAALPVVAMALTAFSVNGAWTTTWLPARYTLDNFGRIVTGRGMAGEAVANSLWMAGLATAVLLVLGVAAGRALRERRRVYEVLVMLPWAPPGTVVAVNLLQAGRPVGLEGTVWLLPLAYAVRGLPLMARASEAALARVPTELEEAARGLGESPGRAFLRVTLPLAGPGVLAGAVLVFAFAMGEYVASILLYGPENLPLSIAIAHEYRLGNLGSAAALGTLLVALLAGVLLVSGRLAAVTAGGRGGRRPPRGDGEAAPIPIATAARPRSSPPSA
ncbi:MAG: ABC transporter permease, partial [Planctomycetota bacterium]